jgi:hypothetical protein
MTATVLLVNGDVCTVSRLLLGGQQTKEEGLSALSVVEALIQGRRPSYLPRAVCPSMVNHLAFLFFT